MAGILIDADVVLKWLRGVGPYAERIPQLLEKGEVLAWSPADAALLFRYVRPNEQKVFEGLFEVLQTLQVTPEVARKAGTYCAAFGESKGLTPAIALVGASAFIYGMPLWAVVREAYPMSDITFYEP